MEPNATIFDYLQFNDGIVSREQYLYLGGIFTLVKAIGEPTASACLILSAIIFLLERKRNATTIYLVVLNLADAAHMAFLPLFNLCNMTPGCEQIPENGHVMLWFGLYLSVSCRRSAQVLNLIVATQRFIAIAFPLRAKTSFLLNHPQFTSLGVLIVSFSVHSYTIVMYEPVTHGVGLSQLGMEYYDMFTTLQFVIMCLMLHQSLVLTSAVNIATIVTLVRHKRKMRDIRNTNAAREKNERSMTIMVLVCSGLFVIRYLPVSTNFVLIDTLPDYGPFTRETYLFLSVASGAMMCQIIAVLFIFISYIMLNANFRKNLIMILFTILCPLPKCRVYFSALIGKEKNSFIGAETAKKR
ncbi:uncharacterized protein LOC106011495 [Aplysia californica]|uniref:Uncharacterized protein LOC106011495 n=1 Tax=Aplysia californica TaxID=6500 RepID=A0ABM0ZY47_APLCA|nr:uncharacterized protein LOC106011495 [Aplysia californica]